VAWRFNAKLYVIRGEDPDELQAFADRCYADYQPANPVEEYYVESLIHAQWNLRRYNRLATTLLGDQPKLVRRQVAFFERSQRRALAWLNKNSPAKASFTTPTGDLAYRS
jgi:hypothetical protein